MPSHIGITANEQADDLAHRAAISHGATEEEYRIMGQGRWFAQDLVTHIKTIFLDQSAAFFEESAIEKGYRYFNKTKTKPGELWFHPQLTGDTVRLISRIRTFHTCTRAHLTDKSILRDASCNFSDAPIQDLDHLLFRCPEFREESDKLILSFRKIGLNDTDATDIAFSGNTAAIFALQRFVKRTGIFI